MLNKYFSNDICDIIKEKLSLDYKKYKFWCFNECKWVYIWTAYDLKNLNIKCPNDNKHKIDSEGIRLLIFVN